MTPHNSGLTPEKEHALHERWISEIEAAWAPLFQGCPDAVYVYIDDEHKTCNQAAADLFGMTVEQFKACESYLDECVDADSVDLVIHNYFQHFVEEMRPLSFEYVAKRQDGSTFAATAFNVPMVHDGEVMLLCFVRPQEDAAEGD